MLFNSLIFLVFAALFFTFWPLALRRRQIRWGYITVASFIFYGWWDWRFLFLIMGSGLLDFAVGLGMVRHPARKKLLLLLSIAGNIGSLAIFKYSGFLATSLDAALSLTGRQTTLADYDIYNFGFSEGKLNPTMFAEVDRRLDWGSNRPVIVLGLAPLTIVPKNSGYLQLETLQALPPAEVFSRRYIKPVSGFFEPVPLSELWGAFTGSRPVPALLFYEEFHDDGWVASWTEPYDLQRSIALFEEVFANSQVSDTMQSTLIRQVEIWIEQGVHVFAFRPPSTMEMEILEETRGLFDEQVFVTDFTAAGGVWFDIPLSPYVSYDGSHVDKASAIRLSADLAVLIADELGIQHD